MEIKVTIQAEPLVQALLTLAEVIEKKSIGAVNGVLSEAVPQKEDKIVTVEEVKEQFEGTEITIEDVRAAFMSKNSASNKVKLKNILDKFGVKKVTDLEVKDFPAVIEALEKL